MDVDLDEFHKHVEFRRKINSAKPSDIRIIKDGKALDLNPEYVDYHRFTGLNTWDFVAAFDEAAEVDSTPFILFEDGSIVTAYGKPSEEEISKMKQQW